MSSVVSPKDGSRPIIQIFAREADWVTWTPEGYFAASPGAEKWVKWRRDEGPGRVQKILPDEALLAKFRRPDVLKLVLKTGSPGEALRIADLEAEAVAAGLPNLYVLAVGVSSYPGDLALKYAASDAEKIDATFRSESGPLFRSVQTRLLTDRKATRTQILQGLDWLKRQMTQDDVGVFFFSGHGEKDDSDRLYLIPADVDPEAPFATSVPDLLIKEAMGAMPGRILCMLDACHAGAIGGDRRKGMRGLTDDLVRDLVTDDYGVVVMASSKGRETSRENDEFRQGAFTQALIEGLSGRADSDRDGTVYLTELEHYLFNRVKALTEGRQHPTSQKPTTIQSFPLARQRPPRLAR